MILGDALLKIKDVCMDFEPYFKVHNLVSVHPKSVILGQMTNLDMVFYIGNRLIKNQYLGSLLFPYSCISTLVSFNNNKVNVELYFRRNNQDTYNV